MLKNERAFLVLLAYIIGLNTAYIGFVFSPDSIFYWNDGPVVQATSVKETISRQVDKTEQSAAVVKAVQEEAGLYAEVNGTKRILSAKSSDGATAVRGFHYAIATALVSPNQQYIYFCEQKTEVPSECDAYVYELATDTIYTVSFQSEQIVATPDNNAVWLADSRLLVDGYVSSDLAEPWLVEPME